MTLGWTKTGRTGLLLAGSMLALVVATGNARAQAVPATAPVPVTAPAPAPAPETSNPTDEVIVTGQRQRGTVEGAPDPIQTLDAVDIEASGATSIAELLATLAPQTTSGRGRGGGGPVVLINGRRVSGFQELRTIPPEAIERVQVLPEETAIQFGFSPDQRVINFILKAAFQAFTVETELGSAAEGASTKGGLEAGFTRIGPTGRLNLSSEYTATSAITEAERGIADQSGGTTNQVRTLTPETTELQLGANYNRTLSKEAAITGDFRYTGSESTSGLGRAGARTLEQNTQSDTWRGAGTLDGYLGDWQWTATAAYDRVERDTFTDQADGSVSRSSSKTGVWDVVGNTNGPILEGPAGPIRGAFRLGVQDRTLDGETVRFGQTTQTSLGRTETLGRASLTIPLTSRRYEFGEGFGDWSLSANASFTDLSDFGGLSSFGGSLRWQPVDEAAITLAFDRAEAAPSIQQLGDPLLITPNVSVFDFARGTSVLVTQTTGGNPGLLAEERNDWSIGGNWTVTQIKGLDLSATYSVNESENAIAGFPVLTPALEAAFPTRFTRDASGTLTAIDRRAINFTERRTEQIRWGFSFSQDIGKAPERPAGFGGPPGGARAGGPGSSGAGAAGPRPGTPPTAGGAAPTPGANAPRPGGPGPTVIVQGGPGRPGGGPPGGGPPGGGFRGSFGGGGGGFGFGGGPPGGAPGRWNISVFHTWKLVDSAILGANSTVLDLLDGDALSSGGGSPRHVVEVDGGAFYRGIGFRLSASYEGPSRIDGTGANSTLFFEDNLTVGLRAFANFSAREDWIRAYPILKNTRLILRVDNLTDSAQRVRDESGATPFAFQRGFVAPRGRFIELALRKQI